MRTVVLDFETYYDKDYSLKKMTPVEYVLDDRFECILCAVLEPWPSGQNRTSKSEIIDGSDFGRWVQSAGLEDACVVSHNALFDMCILSWRYGIRPRLMVDTLGVTRALLGHRLKWLGLSSVAKFLGVGTKGHEVENVIGMSRNQIKASGRWQDYCDYSMNDAELCAEIYNQLVRSGRFPVREMLIMDMVLRCATEPRFILDQQALAEHLADIQRRKNELLAHAMIVGCNSKSELMSNEKFAELLRSVGCEPPRKISKLTGLWTYAFAKTDKEFIALEEHEDPAVQVLVAARTGHKSTLEETRTTRLLDIANLNWPVTQGGNQHLMPVPLRYGGAHTHRLSGDWRLNMQNLPRGGKLRRALIAPPGHKVLAVDASQIEARIVAWICKQSDLLKSFADGEDVYSSFASDVFGYPVNKKNNPNERFIGKTSILGLGYQVGAIKFQNTIEVQSQLQLGAKIDMSLEEAEKIVNFYRAKYNRIPGTWYHLQNIGIPVLAGRGGPFEIGPCKFETGAVLLPSGLRLHYYGLAHNFSYDQLTNDRGWIFTYAEEQKKLYGGKLLENIVQALARIFTMDAALTIQKRIKLALQAHDELVYVVPDEAVGEIWGLLMEVMTTPPAWAPDLPLEAEVGIAQSYGECK
jgi:DNA polymerase I-like protein with 3'-5' exonuclease and polymerase domains